ELAQQAGERAALLFAPQALARRANQVHECGRERVAGLYVDADAGEVLAAAGGGDAVARAVRDAADDAGGPQGFAPRSHAHRRILVTEAGEHAPCTGASRGELAHPARNAV